MLRRLLHGVPIVAVGAQSACLVDAAAPAVLLGGHPLLHFSSICALYCKALPPGPPPTAWNDRLECCQDACVSSVCAGMRIV